MFSQQKTNMNFMGKMTLIKSPIEYIELPGQNLCPHSMLERLYRSYKGSGKNNP